jgi:hypothetical protein
VPLDPRPFIEVGKELRKKPFRVQLLVCWAFGLFWIVTGLFVVTTAYWAVMVGVFFLIVPFVSLAQQRKAG